MADFNFTTGPATLPDVGAISYNGCTFGPVFETKVSGNAIKDNAKRTVKFIEYTITVDGFVTLPAGAVNIGGTMATLYSMLTAQGGSLVYRGRALDIIANPAEKPNDVAWGPIPEMLEFQPLGAGRSAKISWKVTVRLTPPAVANVPGSLGILQLNYETGVSYDEAGFSSLSIKGTMEIPETRISQKNRTVVDTVDSFRRVLEVRILKGIDLGRYHLTRRNFNVSRDKKTMEFDIEAAEKPYMDLPPYCTLAHGSYSVRPVKIGAGLKRWTCTLRATYTVAANQPRKWAYFAFMALMFLRMEESKRAKDDDGVPPPKNIQEEIALEIKNYLKRNQAKTSPRPWLIDYSIDEGQYLDSKTVSFSATWRLICGFDNILIGAGVWRRLPDGGRNQKDNIWAQSMIFNSGLGRSLMGVQSWQTNRLDPKLDIIVDMGSTGV